MKPLKYARAFQNNGPDYFVVSTGGLKEHVFAICDTEEDAKTIVVHANEYPAMLRVVLAAHDLLEHRATDYFDNTMSPYVELKAALDHLAKGVL